MKKPFLYAVGATLYIVIIVFVMNTVVTALPEKTMLIPMAMLGLFVLSATVMGFFFLSEPLIFLIENRKHEAIDFFLKTVAIFACFIAIFLIFLSIFHPLVPLAVF